MEAAAAPSSATAEFVEFVAKLLARSPDEVSVTEQADDHTIVYHLHLSPDDVGRVIGREGRTVRAIRSMLRAAAVRQGLRIVLEID
jgi:predicted RNA-binding protein YlqC (UPF0109 family)